MTAADDDYRALKDGAALATVAQGHQIGLRGTDRASYLQGLLTNDVIALSPGTGCYAAWLTPQGRMLTDMHVLESGDMMLLDVPAAAAAATLQRLDQFLFSEDVQVADMSDSLRAVWVHGPAAAAVVENVLSGASGLDAWVDYQNTRTAFGGSAAVIARVAQLGVPGFCIYTAPDREEDLRRALQAGGARPVQRDAVEAARIEAGYPLFGIDMTEDTIPLEAGIENRAISFTKGCYVGQEVIIRVLHRGHGRVAKRLVALGVEGDPSAAGRKLYADDREVGFVTSAAASPRFGSIALGYVHRDFVAPGTRLTVEADGSRAAAVVSERPFRSGAR
jgi:folate-binding protein YgfZ